ncbi:hypothetical protein FRC18_004820 [Serendipita sp. 400]|nr:hypothetical protein FRC18_004820 [Serendipita sp. 400]
MSRLSGKRPGHRFSDWSEEKIFIILRRRGPGCGHPHQAKSVKPVTDGQFLLHVKSSSSMAEAMELHELHLEEPPCRSATDQQSATAPYLSQDTSRGYSTPKEYLPNMLLD